MYATLLDGDKSLLYSLAAGRKAYLHVARGSVQADKHLLTAGDALMLSDESEITLQKAADAELLLFDLP